MRVALFLTCVNDVAFARTGQAVVRLLERLGVDVDFPSEQTCCGQAHYNTGYRWQAEPLAARYTRVFAGYDAIVTPSGSCAAMVAHHYPRIARLAEHEADDRGHPPVITQRALDQAPPTYELTQFLIDVLKVTDVGAYFPHTVTYHPTCHGLRTLGLADRPTRLLKQVQGLELAELPGADECCGFGGTFAMKNPDVSTAMGTDKLRNAESTNSAVLCAADNSCLMHLGGLATRQNSTLHPVHIAEILASTKDEPYQMPQQPTPQQPARTQGVIR